MFPFPSRRNDIFLIVSYSLSTPEGRNSMLASPPLDVSRYRLFKSSPVRIIVITTSSKEIRCVPSERMAY